MEREETMAWTVDGQIKNILMTKKEKREFKRNKEFYTLEFHRKRNKKIKININNKLGLFL